MTDIRMRASLQTGLSHILKMISPSSRVNGPKLKALYAAESMAVDPIRGPERQYILEEQPLCCTDLRGSIDGRNAFVIQQCASGTDDLPRTVLKGLRMTIRNNSELANTFHTFPPFPIALMLTRKQIECTCDLI